ncbi:MAG TPA: hypothetical protein VG433_16915 [Pirellulales bacterium]|nr:hypothetical protein [Pirellulales bacterium]
MTLTPEWIANWYLVTGAAMAATALVEAVHSGRWRRQWEAAKRGRRPNWLTCVLTNAVAALLFFAVIVVLWPAVFVNDWLPRAWIARGKEVWNRRPQRK